MIGRCFISFGKRNAGPSGTAVETDFGQAVIFCCKKKQVIAFGRFDIERAETKFGRKGLGIAHDHILQREIPADLWT